MRQPTNPQNTIKIATRDQWFQALRFLFLCFV